MSLNDTREIDTGEYRLSSPLCGHRLNNSKVVVDSACVVKPLDICSKGSRILWKTLEVTDTHYLASQQGVLKAKADLVFILEATLMLYSSVWIYEK